jgi:hypothetical protein
LTYQTSKLFHFVDQRSRPNSTTGLSETAECTTAYETTQQGIVNSSNFCNNMYHNSLRAFGISKLAFFIMRSKYLWYIYIYIYICLWPYKKRSIKSNSGAYVWRSICTDVYIRFIFLNNAAVFKVCYCKLLHFYVRLALGLCLLNDRKLSLDIVNWKFLTWLKNYLTFAITFFVSVSPCKTEGSVKMAMLGYGDSTIKMDLGGEIVLVVRTD